MLAQFRFIVAAFLLAVISASTSTAQPGETLAIRVKEGTTLSFDLSPDGRSIVLDLLGQLWLMPATGGQARPITNAVRDISEDLDPSFSPDGRSVVFRGERNGRTGLFLLDISSGTVRQLTQLSNPDAYDGNAAWSPDGRVIAFVCFVLPDSPLGRPRSAIMLLDTASGKTQELSIDGVKSPFLSDPIWLPDGKEIAFVTRIPNTERGGRIWIVAASGGQARAVTAESVQAQAPAFSPDARFLAYFAPDSAGKTQVWVQEINTGRAPVRLTNHVDVTSTRIRWVSGDGDLLYSADGRLWKVGVSGGPAKEISFTAELSITRARRALAPPRFNDPGQQAHARGFMGLALSPDGRHIGMLALGKLWMIPVDGGTPRAVAAVPFEATSLAWSPDNAEVAWSAGGADQEDLFATNVATGVTRQVSALPGREAYPAYSPDGRHLAFVHVEKDDGLLRIVSAGANKVSDVGQTQNLSSIGLRWTSPPQWSPESDGLLVSGPADLGQPGRATFVPLSGPRQEITRFPNAPIFLQWTSQHTIVFVRHDRLWQARFDRSGMLGDPQPIGADAALYASSSRDGTVLFVSAGGLRLRLPDSTERNIGWPISYTPPVAESTLIRNVRIIDGTGAPITEPRDVLIEQGRIKKIAATGKLSTAGGRVLDAAGRVMIPGLMDLHAHGMRPNLYPGFLYFGITTVRDQGSSMAPLVAYADAFAAGALPGPRVDYGGFQFYSDWPFDTEEWRGIEPEADPDHIKRAVGLAEAFGAQHIKTRTFRRWDINTRMITEAHRRGMRATGHCSHLLPLVAAGMDAKEHIGLCEPRGNKYMYDDLIQLFKAAGIGVVPTISYLDFAARLNERPALIDEDAEVSPFLPAKENFDWMFKLTADSRKEWAEDAQRSREVAVKLLRAGVTVGAGTDIWQVPTGVHMELEQLVAAGLTPAQAIHAGTGASARIIGAEKDLGTIEVGKWADLIILDADPLVDIRNTRKIWRVIHYGRVVDRSAIRATDLRR
ncbi:MAG TPA: amidohydrolase family protein [Pyrinomonadaceae bacterium]|nr:amidohydrolase family protein [Pyrinomonadaceae bacterium]